MRVVIAGGGNVGPFIANDLARRSRRRHRAGPDVVADRPRASPPPGRRRGVEWWSADACEVTSLPEADLDAADVVVAVTGDDEDNLVISLLAKQEFAVPRVVARVNNPRNEWMFNETWGVDVSVSTPHLIPALVEEAVSVGSLVRLLQLEGAGPAVRGHPRRRLPGRRPEIASSAPPDSTVVAIIREDHVVVPRGDTVLEAGDEVLALVTPDSEDAIRRMLTGK